MSPTRLANGDGGIDVPEGGSFNDMVALRGDKEIGDKINKIIGRLADANEPLKGVIDQADFNDETKLGTGKEMQDRLTNLIGIFNNLDDLSGNRAEGDDLLGDAYEYLMRHFATESGKSKGQFYTPAEVSRIMAKVIGIGADTTGQHTIYDPTCGSGSLLLRAADEAPRGLSIYGQEKDNATYALAWMNMILHDYDDAELKHGNTLATPNFIDDDGKLTRFNFAVANPPFSDKGWTSGLNLEHDPYNRFDGYSIPPAKNGDYAFLLHFIASLKSDGKGAIILPHGVLFRGNKEADIRRNLIRRGYIKGIIGLPANLFYGTGIPACIIVIDKEHANTRHGIFMIDASKGFLKDSNKNRLRAQDIHRIVSVFNEQTEIEGYSRMVPTSEISDTANAYNLNIPRYIDNSDPEDIHDLNAHLNGGIPDTDIDALNDYWQEFPTLRDALFIEIGRSGYSDLQVDIQQVKSMILSHNEFTAYQQRVTSMYEVWRDTQKSLLGSIDANTKPRDVINALSENILVNFTDLRLLDAYAVYQQLMDYWDEVMQDDVYLISAVGWVEASKPRETDQKKKIKETPNLTIGKKKYMMDLIPPALIVARYFATEQDAIEVLQTKQATAESELAGYVEEHTGEDGLLSDAKNNKGDITASSVNARLKAIQGEQESKEEEKVLTSYALFSDAVSKSSRAIKKEQKALDQQVLTQYSTLTEIEIKTIVVEDKWVANVQSAIKDEVQHMTQELTGRVQELKERYAKSLPDLTSEIDEFSTKVDAHLRKMGVDRA